MTFYETYKGGNYSQQGEHGIITECLKRIGLSMGTAIEFGAPTKQYCSNIFELPDTWRKLYYDINPTDEGVEQKMITPENVNELPACFILSIDIDGNDYAVWRAYEGQPDIVIIEVNSSIPPEIYHFSKEKGCSFAMMNSLAEDKGYFLLCHTGNCIYILNKYRELFPDADDNFKTDWL